MSIRQTAASPQKSQQQSFRPRTLQNSAFDEVFFAGLFRHAASIDGSGKRKKGGDLADTRLGKPISNTWTNERFRQTMLLILEFRLHNNVLSSEDVEFLRIAVDVALSEALRAGHTASIYDMSPIVWAIWLVQHAHATRTGGWTVASLQAQLKMSVVGGYLFLEHQQSLGENKNLTDPMTGVVLKRYKLPFKAKMNIPPKQADLFKWRRGARQLSEWMTAGGLPPLARGIIEQLPPEIVAVPLPEAEQIRVAAQRDALWRAVAERARQRQLDSASGGDADDRETRDILEGVMSQSRGGGMTDEEVRQLEAALERGPEGEGDAEPDSLMIPVTAERIGPPSVDDPGGVYENMTFEQLLLEVQTL